MRCPTRVVEGWFFGADGRIAQSEGRCDGSCSAAGRISSRRNPCRPMPPESLDVFSSHRKARVRQRRARRRLLRCARLTTETLQPHRNVFHSQARVLSVALVGCLRPTKPRKMPTWPPTTRRPTRRRTRIPPRTRTPMRTRTSTTRTPPPLKVGRIALHVSSCVNPAHADRHVVVNCDAPARVCPLCATRHAVRPRYATGHVARCVAETTTENAELNEFKTA